PYTTHIPSDCLWFVEAQSALYGGPIKLKSDKVRFKHLNTGLYLLCVTSEEEEGEKIVITCSKSPDIGSLFSVDDVSTTKLLSNNKALQIGGPTYTLQ
ncbi:hypothetical protein B484DRAFT_390232, partial [Ochromonadaceae sp. CCMP2298]